MVWLIDILGEVFLAAVPLAFLVGLIISLVQYKKCPPENTEERKKHKLAAKVYGIILGVMVLSAAALMIFLAAAITHM